MGTENKPPLWQQIPSLFGYPLYPVSAILFSIIACIALQLPYFNNLFLTIALSILLLTVFFTFCLPMFSNIISGHHNTPSWSDVYEEFDTFLIAQHTLLFLILGFGIVILHEENLPILIYISGFLSILFLPAILMILYIDKSLVQALNPFLAMQLIHTLGTSYLAICLITSLMVMLVAITTYTLSTILPAFTLELLIFYISIYCSIILYLVMGYVLYQNNIKFDHNGTMIHPKAENQGLKASSLNFVQAANAKIAAGELIEASEFFQKALSIDSLNLDLHKQYHELLLTMNDNKELNHHGRNYIRKLLARNLGVKAGDTFKTICKKIPDFHLEEVPVAITLATILRDTHHYQLSVKVLSELHKYCPNDSNIPEAYLLLAQIYSEKLNQDKKAKQILEYILIHYTDHPLQKIIKSHLDCLMRL